ncbi:MAG TPA: DUF47 family protein, partial [Clostridia bacterium]|nr:DUF47 family protein [Clostridia bacterium]
MGKSEKHDYFEMMKGMVACSLKASEMLEDTLRNFRLDTLEPCMKQLHAVEHQADQLKHVLVERLVKEFITPIDREDIMSIASQIDDVTDAVEDVLIKIYMFDIKDIPPAATEFAAIIRDCCRHLLLVFSHFADFKRSKEIHPAIVEINRQEELGDDLYLKAVHDLYATEKDSIRVTAWTEVYACLEKCCDTCENT